MKLPALILGAAIVLTGMPQAAQAQAPVEEQAVKPVQVGNKICPVSGEKIAADSGMAPVTYEYQGKSYNLCCQGCISLFQADPEKYSAIADLEVMKDKEQAQDAPKGNMPMGHQM